MGFTRNFSLTFISNALLVAIGIATNVVIVRLLGPAGQGQFTVVSTTANILMTLAGGGAVLELNRYLSRMHHTRVRRIFFNSSLFTLCAAGTLYLAYSALRVPFLRFLPSGRMAYLVLLAVPLILFQEANKGILWGLERIGEYNLVNLIRTGLFLLFSAPLLIFISRSAEAAVTGWLAGLLLSAGASAWFILKDRHFSRPPADSAQVRSDSLRIGWRTFLISALFMVSAKADIYVLKFFLSDAAIGYYSLVVLISSMANIGPAVVGLLLFNKTLTEGAIGITQTAKLSRICLAYSFVLAACLAVLGKPIFICLFGDSFVKSYYCLLYYLPALVAQNLIAVLAMFICAKRGFPFFDIATLLEVLVAGIILNILLVPKLGINGSAIAASVAISIRAVMDIIYFKRLSRLSLSEALLVKKGDIEEIAGILRRSPLKV